MNCFRFAPIVLLTAAIALSPSPAVPQSDAQPAPPPVPRASMLSAIDKTADPCTDFTSTHAETGSKQSHSRRPGALGRSFSLLQERNRYLLWQELDAASKDPKTPLKKKYGDYYAACMNTDLADKKGLEPSSLPLNALRTQGRKNLGPLIGRWPTRASRPVVPLWRAAR